MTTALISNMKRIKFLMLALANDGSDLRENRLVFLNQIL